MALSDFFARLFGGSPRVDLWSRYERLREGVSGTMSQFYKVRDVRSGEVRGLKILDRVKSAPIEARYKQLGKPGEGEIGKLIKGTNIARTLEWGTSKEGHSYILMEFVEGKLLHTVLSARQQLMPAQRLDFVRQAAEAVAVVHDAGFIHRDICPRNFMVRPDGTLVLFDFGLTVPDKPVFLRPGNRIGTPSYMAPEVVRRQPISRRIDMFSFGVTAYEICTLELPWPRSPGAKGALRHDSPPQDIREFWPDIPPPLADAIMACISADAGRRPESLGKFLEAIKDVRF